MKMYISNYLAAVLVVFFLLQTIIPNFTSMFMLDPLVAMQEPWCFVTSIFLHTDIFHLFLNGLALIIFGILVEQRMKPHAFLVLFFGSGITGSLLYYATYFFGIIPPVPELGASGAVYGILGAAAILFPEERIYAWFIPMKLKYAAILWIIIEFLGSFSIESGIASAAHLGGLIFGILFTFYLDRNHRKHEMDRLPPNRSNTDYI